MKLYTKEAALDQIAELLGLDPEYSTEDVVQMAWNAWARGVHSCSDNCTRPLCVAHRDIERLEELFEKWLAEATKQSERADAAEARLRALTESVARLRGQASSDLKPDRFTDGWKSALDELSKEIAARQQGGAE